MHPTPLYGDNDSTIILSTEYSNKHRRSKGQVLKMLRLGTKELPPDVGTKIGGGTEFQEKIQRVMGSTQ